MSSKAGFSAPTCNSPYNDDDPESGNSGGGCGSYLRRLFPILFGLVVISGTIAFLVWLTIRPHVPKFRVDSFSMSNLTVTNNNSLVSFTSDIHITSRNPNKKVSLDYGRIRVVIFYRSDPITETTVPPITEAAKEEKSFTASFQAAAGSSSFVADVSKNRGNNVGLRLEMYSRVSFVGPAWWIRYWFLTVSCHDLNVSIPTTAAAAGSLTGVPPKCHVRM